jgi:hypothetical protein
MPTALVNWLPSYGKTGIGSFLTDSHLPVDPEDVSFVNRQPVHSNHDVTCAVQAQLHCVKGSMHSQTVCLCCKVQVNVERKRA